MIYKYCILSLFTIFYLSCGDDPKSSEDSSSSDDDESGMTVTDIDGNVYDVVEIGTQWWMTENLKVTRYRKGDVIPYESDHSSWEELTSGVYCVYDNDPFNTQTYGLLYNWYAGNDDRNIAPEGWHVPSKEEWQILIGYLGGFEEAGGKMKEIGTSHWASPNTGATNESGFTALPGGARTYMMGDVTIGGSAFFMSSSDDNGGFWCLHLSYLYERLAGEDWSKNSGVSIRCVKDSLAN